MNIAPATTTEMVMIISVAVMLAAGTGTVLLLRKRRADWLLRRFGRAECSQVVDEGGLGHRSERHGEGGLDSWRGVPSRLVDGPASTVWEADQLIGDVMSTRGYPVRELARRSARVSADRPLVLAHYRTAHDVATRRKKGACRTEDLRQAMMDYLTCSRN